MQRVVSNFLEWIANIELALQGVEISCRHVFDNRLSFGMLEKLQAEKLRTEILVTQVEKGLLTTQQAIQRLAVSEWDF